MAEHVVPQNVEADDKLIGPFGFRQFVYLMIAAAAGFLGFMLGSNISWPLALIPAPICAFFLVIALPLRKDQPTEIYLAALVKYIFKPHTRIWQADGEQPLVEISAPIVDDSPKTKDLAGDEVSRRLSFLANLSDTQGWSTRGLNAPVNNTNLNDEFASDAANAQDIMENSAISNNIGELLDKSDRQMRMNAINRMNNVVGQSASQQSAAMPQSSMFPNSDFNFSAPVYPTSYTQADVQAIPDNSANSFGNFNLQQVATPQPKHNVISPTPSVSVAPTYQQYTASAQPTYATASTMAPQPSAQPTVEQLSQPVPKPGPLMQAPQYQLQPVMQQPAPAAPQPPIINTPSQPVVPSDSKPAIIESDKSLIDIKLH